MGWVLLMMFANGINDNLLYVPICVWPGTPAIYHWRQFPVTAQEFAGFVWNLGLVNGQWVYSITGPKQQWASRIQILLSIPVKDIRDICNFWKAWYSFGKTSTAKFQKTQMTRHSDIKLLLRLKLFVCFTSLLHAKILRYPIFEISQKLNTYILQSVPGIPPGCCFQIEILGYEASKVSETDPPNPCFLDLQGSFWPILLPLLLALH